MSEAVLILERYAFDQLALNRIQIKTDKENLASVWVAKKCWYIYEWTCREAYFNEYYNAMRDFEIYAKLKSDYLKEHN